MSDMWSATIHVWPHSSGNGHASDQALAGERVQRFDFVATDINDALRVAKAIARGVETNPAVWQAPIMALARAALMTVRP